MNKRQYNEELMNMYYGDKQHGNEGDIVMNVQQSFSTSRWAGMNNRGTLYLVGTPIGNLEDMTFRAIRTLKEVDLIAAEDTRQTRKLLTHFEISTRLVSYHEHNKEASGTELIRLLKEGTIDCASK